MTTNGNREVITTHIEDAKVKRISRRQFIHGVVAAGLSASAASTLFSNKVLAQAPQKGGKFRIGVGHGAISDTLDPATYENDFIIPLSHAKNNYLTEINNDGSLKPELAENFESSADASNWTFKLRNVNFHSGKPVTAEDVIASINHHRGEGSQSAAKPLVSQIKEIKSDNQNTITFKLAAGNADFPFTLSDYHFPILPANADGSLDWKSGDGCGAYVLKDFNPGVRATLERNPDYWKNDRGHFDKIELLSIIDPAARTNGLISGELDAIDRVDLKTVSLLKRSKNIAVHQVEGLQHFSFPMHTNVAPFNDINVRLALKHALNREELVEKILQGYGSIGNDHPIASTQMYFNQDLSQTRYDPEKARSHLKKAGMDSLNVDLHVADAAFPGAIDAATLYAQQAKPAGITINVVREPNDGYWSNVWLNKPFCACYWDGFPTEDLVFSTAYASGADWNDTFFEHERFNELLLSARSELSEDSRRAMYYEMQEILNQQGGTIIPMFSSYVFATTDKVGFNTPFGSVSDVDGSRSLERWWFKS